MFKWKLTRWRCLTFVCHLTRRFNEERDRYIMIIRDKKQTNRWMTYPRHSFGQLFLANFLLQVDVNKLDPIRVDVVNSVKVPLFYLFIDLFICFTRKRWQLKSAESSFIAVRHVVLMCLLAWIVPLIFPFSLGTTEKAANSRAELNEIDRNNYVVQSIDTKNSLPNN